MHCNVANIISPLIKPPCFSFRTFQKPTRPVSSPFPTLGQPITPALSKRVQPVRPGAQQELMTMASTTESGDSVIRGERIVFWWSKTNTNIIRLFKNGRIRILFGLKKATEYKYEYYSARKKQPNTNTNIIRFEKIYRIRIRILFGLKKSPEYECEY